MEILHIPFNEVSAFKFRFYGATVIKENVQVGYIVGNVTCKDPDIGQKHIFTVIGHYSSVFQVNTSGNQLYVINSSFLNYEALHVPALLLVSIQATDVPVEQTGPPLHVISDVNISVVDVNEPPTDIRLIPDNISIPENVSIGYCIAQITSSNPERSQKVNYTLLHHQDTFAIKDTCDNNSSVVNDAKGDLPYLTVKSHLSYNYYRIYEVLIEAEDNGIPPLSFNGTVDVNVTKIDPCWSLPCQENSKCRRVDWQNYTCPCNAGYSGDGRVNCYEIDECLSSPCGNGTCHDYVNYYNCTCPSGYYNGMSCSNMINFCLSNPCQNNATCWVHLNGYNCSCVLGFTGLHCETNIDDCASEPCTEGVYVDGINQFTCNCSGSGFFGTRCQRKLGVNRENKDSPLTDNKHFMNKRLYYVIGATGGLLFVVFAVLLICRKNSLSAKERRLIRSQRFSDNTDDETYTDARYRHHMANQETENAGAINPIYGTNEEGANVTTLDNPICQEPDQKNGTPHVKRSESTTGFENSMYFRFRPGKEEEEGGEEEEDKDDFKEEKDGAKSPTGFANPMFSLYRQPKTEAGASGDAVPVKQEKKAAKNKGTSTYETPKKKKKPANEELQVVEACSFFNPPYKTRAQVEEPEKKFDEELPGESDC